MARAVGAVLFSIIIGLVMAFIYRKDDAKRAADARLFAPPDEKPARSLGQMIVYMASMVGILVFVNWASSSGGSAVWDAIYAVKWWITGAFAIILASTVIRWFNREERLDWVASTRDFSLQILPLLFGGVLVAGLLGAGMGQGPALALLLAGPSLSLPSILVIGGELGWKKTLTYVMLVVVLSTLAGLGFGAII